jgi:hypothetical protein
MNFYDILAAEKWGGGIPTMNFFDLLFAQSISGEQWQTYEGTLPATLNANGDDMRQYQIYGNTGGVGDRTVQLFDKNDPDVLMGYEIYNGEIRPQSYWFITGYIPVEQGQYYSKKSFGQNILGYNQSKEKVSDNASLSPIENGISFIRLNALKENINSAMLTEGSTPPASFVPFGYKLDMSVSSGNLCYKEITGANIDGTVTIIADSRYNTCVFECTQGETYTIKNEDTVIVYAFFDSEPRMGSSPYDDARVVVSGNTVSFTAPITGWCATRYIATSTPAMAVRGSAIPEKYQPYYNTVIPIYIGDEPLDKDEYVDFSEQKIYRMVDGTLTPTNPPVTLPALPTAEGETIIDYAGESVAPEKVLLEYAKGGN